MDQVIRNADFAARLALAYADLMDGVRPTAQRVSIRVTGDGRQAELELRNVEADTVDFWRLSRMRRIPDQARQDTLVLARDDTDPARLILREAEAVRIILGTCPKMPELSGSRGIWPKLLMLGAAAAACIAGILFILVPFMADRGAAMMPPRAEVAFGESTFGAVYGEGAALCSSPAGNAALAKIQDRILHGIGLPYRLRVRVVNDPMINAFALPGGLIVIHRGLIDAAQAPEEVAAVLAHEIGHVVHRDGTRAALRAMGSFGIVGLVFGDVLGGSVVAGVTQQLISSAHSREAELSADSFARDRLQAVGLPTQALGDMFSRMQAAGLAPEMGVFRHLSTHPELVERIEAAGTTPAGASFAPALSPGDWQALRAICS